MKIRRLAVSELRQFRSKFELPDLQPGLNIISGANQQGKSTLVRAIRAAFLERHKSTSVEDLRPQGDSAAQPTVTIDFSVGDKDCTLVKSFLHKKRCDLRIGNERKEGTEAEDALAQLLGFQFALKGISREEHWGVPGLLWIEQGQGQSVRNAVVYASDHLRKAVEADVGEVASTAGDEVVAEITRQREALLTGGGKPTGEYQKAITAETEAAERLKTIAAQVTGYRQDVDLLAQLRAEHQSDEQQRPWEALQARQLEAQRELDAAKTLQSEQQTLATRIDQTEQTQKLLKQRLEAIDMQQRALETRKAAVEQARTKHQAELEDHARRGEEATKAADHSAAAVKVLARARLEDTRRALTEGVHAAQEKVEQLTAGLARAREATARVAAAKGLVAELEISEEDLKQLRATAKSLDQARVRRAAAATRVRFELAPGASVEVDGEQVTGGERLLVASATVNMPGLGRLHIAPGGKDLMSLAAEEERLANECAAQLQRLGLSTLEALEARLVQHGRAVADQQTAENEVGLLAPVGIEALEADLQQQRGKLSDAQRALAALPPPDGEPAVDVAVAMAEESQARALAASAATQLASAATAVARTEALLLSAQTEYEAQLQALSDGALVAEYSEKLNELGRVDTALAGLRADAATLKRKLEEVRPEILEQTVRRFQQSAQGTLSAHQQRAVQIATIHTRLDVAGRRGLEEEFAATKADAERTARRRYELKRRAEGLDLLLRKLLAHREALTQRLQAPLRRHLDRYLRLVFPGATLDLDPNMAPGTMSQPGPEGLETHSFEALSFGAREQLGVLTRLAYADLLKEAGRPTLLILDDALVHSDSVHIDRMKRAIFDAASRHQVLLFTCHPEAWRDMGVTVRRLEALREAPAISLPSAEAAV